MAISLIENDAYVHAHDDCIDAVKKREATSLDTAFSKHVPL